MLPIKITDSASIGRGKTHRVVGRKYDRNACRGFYCQEWHGKPAWIQLVADNIVAGYPTFLLRFQLLRDLVVAEVLYNASGLDGRQGSAGKRPERRSRGQDRSGVSFPAPVWFAYPRNFGIGTRAINPGGLGAGPH